MSMLCALTVGVDQFQVFSPSFSLSYDSSGTLIHRWEQLVVLPNGFRTCLYSYNIVKLPPTHVINLRSKFSSSKRLP